MPIERLNHSPGLSEKEKIREACRQFEAVLLRQILDSARKPLHAEGIEGSSASDDVYRDMVTNQLADSISRSGSFGLARALEVELTRQELRPPSPPQQPLSAEPVKLTRPEPRPAH